MTSRARTSKSHPLQIAAVSTGEGFGRIGITFCPGKKQPGALTGAWDRDLVIDVASIAEWGAAAVVTLVELHELDTLGVSDLGKVVAAHHMDWWHLPIRDVSTPCARFDQQWIEAAPKLRSLLTNGFDIVVHCKGGLGRAGMIAARLLIELGWNPQTALDAVREVRPGAVETAAQQADVLGYLPLPQTFRSADADADACRNRAIGSMLGLAVGDAVGMTLEFARRDSRPMLTDMVGGGPFGLKAGEWTDDTAMALALTDSLVVDRSLDERDLMQRFVAWRRDGTYSCTGRCFDIGITTSSALSRFERSGDPRAGSTDPHSAGNGSLMRLAPVALAHWRDRDLLADVARRQSITTHAADEAVEACVLFADMLADAISGMAPDALFVSERNSASRAIAAVGSCSWRGKHRDAIRSSGYVVHSLEAAIWCVARTSDFRSAVLLAANLGDDADTVAAITGQLAGAIYGLSGIPTDWLDKLAWRERLEATARELAG